MSTPNLDSRYITPSGVDAKIATQATTDAGQYATKANNLSDLSSAAIARSNLGAVGKGDLVLNVLDYGAVGDGTLHLLSSKYGSLSAAQADYPFVTALTQSQDWAAWQKAVNALPQGTTPVFGTGRRTTAGGGIVLAPANTYHFGSDTLLIPSNPANAKISGYGAKIISDGATAGAAIMRTGSVPYQLNRWSFEGFELSSTFTFGSTSGTLRGFDLLRACDCTFKDLWIWGFQEDGLRFQEAQWCNFQTVVSQLNGKHGLVLDDSPYCITTLAANYTAGDTTLSLATTTGNNPSGGYVTTPTSGQVRVGPQLELNYTGISGNTLTGVSLRSGTDQNIASGASTLVMAHLASNNMRGYDIHLEKNGLTGLLIRQGQGNSFHGSTSQYQAHSTTLITTLATNDTTISADTTGFAPSGWAVIDKGSDSGDEVFYYASMTYGSGGSFNGVIRGYQSSTAVAHTAGVAIRQGVGIHVRNGLSIANTFSGMHLEQNMWHLLVEAGTPNTQLNLPRGVFVTDTFWVNDSTVTRFVVNEGTGTVVSGNTQNSNITLTRNGVAALFEIWLLASSNQCGDLTVKDWSKVGTMAALVSDQTGSTLIQWTGPGTFKSNTSEQDVIRTGSNAGLYYYLSSTNGVRALATSDSNNVIIGNTSYDTHIRGTKVYFYGTSGGDLNSKGAARQAISGSKASNAALASLITALANIGLITDSTT